MKIHAIHKTFMPALLAMIATLHDEGASPFTVERSKPASNDLPVGAVAIYSIEDTEVDVCEVQIGDTTTYVVLEYGNGVEDDEHGV